MPAGRKPKDPKRVAAGKKAKRKGGAFERWVARELAEVTGKEFQKTPGSGGSPLGPGWKLKGDVATTDKKWPYCVECKDQEDWRLEQILATGGLIWGWWEQTVEESAENGALPCMIFKRNHVKPMVLVSQEIVIDPEPVPICVQDRRGTWLWLLTFEGFLNYVSTHLEQFVVQDGRK